VLCWKLVCTYLDSWVRQFCGMFWLSREFWDFVGKFTYMFFIVNDECNFVLLMLDSGWFSLISTLVNPRRSPEASLEESRSDGCIWISLQSGPLMAYI
jgi:hypothetical protein